jgi:hypothetical protein
MMRKYARKKRFWVERLQLVCFFALVFAAPLYFGFAPVGGDYFYVFALSMVAFSLPIVLGDTPRATVPNLENRHAIELLFLVALVTMVFTYSGIGMGLSDRASIRAGTTNTNMSGSFLITLISNSNFLVSGIAAHQIQKGLDARRRKNLYLGIILAVAMLTTTGTRFLFLLSTAPLFYSFFFDSRYLRKLLLFVLTVLASSFAAIARSGFNINAATLIFFDLPSTASALAVEGPAPSFLNIGYFFVGNIVVLIPRALFPGKPVDPTVVDLTISQLGNDAFDTGATYLPGFIGSAWLYGAWIVVAIFSFLLGYLFLKSFPNDSRSSTTQRTLKALLFIGLILQFRNISIFYLLPYLFMAIGLRGTAAMRSFLPMKRMGPRA